MLDRADEQAFSDLTRHHGGALVAAFEQSLTTIQAKSRLGFFRAMAIETFSNEYGPDSGFKKGIVCRLERGIEKGYPHACDKAWNHVQV